MTEEEIKETNDLLDKLEAKVRAILDYCKNSPVITDASQKCSLRSTAKKAKELTHQTFQTLSALEMSGITMKPTNQAQSELLLCAQQLRQIADRITLTVWEIP